MSSHPNQMTPTQWMQAAAMLDRKAAQFEAIGRHDLAAHNRQQAALCRQTAVAALEARQEAERSSRQTRQT